MKKYSFLLLLAFIILPGCGSKQLTLQQPITNTNGVTNAPINKVVEPQSISGEIANPGLTLPTDINPAQVQKYFMFDGIYYALVMQSSMNIPLETKPDFKLQFIGVLKASKGESAWSKFIEIKDKNDTDKNNPYYLWQENNQLFLSVVDQNGAGSGEGIMKLIKIADNQANIIGCYYFPNPEPSETYFSNTRKYQQFDSQPIADCNNLLISLLKQL
jgi:hypothetical protein